MTDDKRADNKDQLPEPLQSVGDKKSALRLNEIFKPRSFVSKETARADELNPGHYELGIELAETGLPNEGDQGLKTARFADAHFRPKRNVEDFFTTMQPKYR